MPKLSLLLKAPLWMIFHCLHYLHLHYFISMKTAYKNVHEQNVHRDTELGSRNLCTRLTCSWRASASSSLSSAIVITSSSSCNQHPLHQSNHHLLCWFFMKSALNPLALLLLALSLAKCVHVLQSKLKPNISSHSSDKNNPKHAGKCHNRISFRQQFPSMHACSWNNILELPAKFLQCDYHLAMPFLVCVIQSQILHHFQQNAMPAWNTGTCTLIY